MTRRLRNLSSLFALWVAVSLSACFTVGPDYEAPEPPAPSALETAALAAEASEPAHDWWRALSDPSLDALVDRAFAANRDLQRAAANVRAARAVLDLEEKAYLPTGEVRAEYQRRRLSGAAFDQDDNQFDDNGYTEVGLAAAWELDFFGRVARATEAALAEAWVAEFLRRDAQALVAAETVRAYVDYRGTAVERRIAQDNLRIQREGLALAQTRLEEGLGADLDVARAATLTQRTQASLPPLREAERRAVFRLATLTGTSAATVERWLGAAGGALEPPARLAIGDVRTLLRRRADVRAAERTLAAATARIGVAKADFFPRVGITGGVSLGTTSPTDVGAGGLGYGVGPSLVWSPFDIPRVRAAVASADARTQAALASYEQSVLRAIEETQGALIAYDQSRQRRAALVGAARSAAEASALARARYEAGADDYLSLLDAEARRVEIEAAQAREQAEVARAYVDVHRALGAGWRPVEAARGG